MQKAWMWVLGAAALLVSAAHAADDFPSRPLQIISHTAPGSATDIFAREIARALEPVLKQPVVVVNRVGGNGAAQMAALKASTPDGYTLGVNTTTHLSLFNTTLKGTYARDDFTWIARLQLDPYVTYVAAGSPLKSLKDLVEFAKNKSKAGQKMSVSGSLAVGGSHNIAFHMLARAAGFDFSWVAFPGTAEIATAALGGHVDAAHGNPGPVEQLAKAGKVRVLGVFSDKRIATFPDVPTYGELGYKVDTSWIQVRGLYANKGVPRAVQERFAQALRDAIKSAAWQKYMHDSSLIDGFLGPDDYTNFVALQEKLTVDWLKQLGILK